MLEAEADDTPLATELAWEFVGRIRRGEQPSRKEYIERLPDEKNRERFTFLIQMDAFAQAFADISADLELKKSLSELPKDGPDIVQE